VSRPSCVHVSPDSPPSRGLPYGIGRGPGTGATAQIADAHGGRGGVGKRTTLPWVCCRTACHTPTRKGIPVGVRCCETVRERLHEGHNQILLVIRQAEIADRHVDIVRDLWHRPAVHFFCRSLGAVSRRDVVSNAQAPRYARIFGHLQIVAKQYRLCGGAKGIRTAGAARPYIGGIRPEFGASFGPNKSIRAGENLFAWNSALYLLSPVPFVRWGDVRDLATSDARLEFDSPPPRWAVSNSTLSIRFARGDVRSGVAVREVCGGLSSD
jgi:hypothetical protein